MSHINCHTNICSHVYLYRVARERWRSGFEEVQKRFVFHTRWMGVIDKAREQHVITVTERIQHLDLFSTLSKTELETLCARATMQPVLAGESIFATGESISHFMVLCSGSIDILHERTRIATISEGEGFGEFELLIKENCRLLSARAVKSCWILTFPVKIFRRHWPHKEALMNKLHVFQEHLIFKELESEQRAILYYGMKSKGLRVGDGKCLPQHFSFHFK